MTFRIKSYYEWGGSTEGISETVYYIKADSFDEAIKKYTEEIVRRKAKRPALKEWIHEVLELPSIEILA